MSYVMKPPVAVHVGFARAALCCVFVATMGGAALAQAAQTTGEAAPKPEVADAAVTHEPPPGGCMPIGVTVSGQIVFAFQCKDFIEQQKAANQKPGAADEKPATAEEEPEAGQGKAATADEKPLAAEKPPAVEKPLAVEKTAARRPDGVVVPVKLATAQPGLLPKHADRGVGPRGCTHFRSYNATSATYLSFDGQRYPCREMASQVSSRK
jgi:BA14K-like protein